MPLFGDETHGSARLNICTKRFFSHQTTSEESVGGMLTLHTIPSNIWVTLHTVKYLCKTVHRKKKKKKPYFTGISITLYVEIKFWIKGSRWIIPLIAKCEVCKTLSTDLHNCLPIFHDRRKIKKEEEEGLTGGSTSIRERWIFVLEYRRGRFDGTSIIGCSLIEIILRKRRLIRAWYKDHIYMCLY